MGRPERRAADLETREHRRRIENRDAGEDARCSRTYKDPATEFHCWPARRRAPKSTEVAPIILCAGEPLTTGGIFFVFFRSNQAPLCGCTETRRFAFCHPEPRRYRQSSSDRWTFLGSVITQLSRDHSSSARLMMTAAFIARTRSQMLANNVSHSRNLHIISFCGPAFWHRTARALLRHCQSKRINRATLVLF